MLDGSFAILRGGLIPVLMGLACSRGLADESRPPSNPAPGVQVAQRADLEDAPLIAATTSPGVEHPLAPAIRIAQKSLARMQAIEDYEATLVRKERLDGPLMEQTIHLKVRERPLSLYLKYGEPHQGRELLYVHGQHDDRVLVGGDQRGTFPVSTVVEEGQSSKESHDSRYRITDYGMRQMLEKVISQWKLESLYGEIDVQFYPDARLRGQPCEVIESSHPRPRRQFQYQKTRLYIDAQSRLPVRIEQFAFPSGPGKDSEIDELYEYVNLRTNVGLTDRDFDQRNPRYSF